MVVNEVGDLEMDEAAESGLEKDVEDEGREERGVVAATTATLRERGVGTEEKTEEEEREGEEAAAIGKGVKEAAILSRKISKKGELRSLGAGDGTRDSGGGGEDSELHIEIELPVCAGHGSEMHV